jgi:hypothetical protein
MTLRSSWGGCDLPAPCQHNRLVPRELEGNGDAAGGIPLQARDFLHDFVEQGVAGASPIPSLPATPIISEGSRVRDVRSLTGIRVYPDRVGALAAEDADRGFIGRRTSAVIDKGCATRHGGRGPPTTPPMVLHRRPANRRITSSSVIGPEEGAVSPNAGPPDVRDIVRSSLLSRPDPVTPPTVQT